MTTETAPTMIPAPRPRKPRHVFLTAEQAVRFGAANAREFNGVAGEAPLIGETAAAIAKNTKQAPRWAASLLFDAYNALALNRVVRTAYGHALQKDLLDRIQRDPAYQDLRNATVSDPIAAGLGACGITRQVIEAVPEPVKEQARKEQEAREEAEEMKTLADAAAADPASTVEQVEAARAEADDAAAKAARQAALLRVAVQGSGKQIGAAVAAAVRQAAGDVGDYKTTLEAVAGREAGTGTAEVNGGLSTAEKLKLAERVRGQGGKLKRMADLLGRMTREALRKQAAKTHHDAGEVVGVEQGDNIDQLMDDEVLALRMPRTRRWAQARLLDAEMMMHEVKSRDPEAKGDIVVLVDESGSMSGTREAEAKAVVVALAHVAAKQKRRLVAMTFQSTVTATFDLDPAKGPGWKTLLALLERGTAGGTSFEAPIRAGMAVVRAGLPKADFLMLTDGQCDVNDKLLADLKEFQAQTQARVYTMLIGDEAARSKDAVAKFSDRVWTAESLLGAASDLFEMV